MRDLDKHKNVFNSYRGNPAIAETVLDQVVGQLEGNFSALNGVAGKAGQSLTENEWLMSIRSRAGIPGGTCEFDLPAYYAWQHRTAASRRADLERWSNTLSPLASSIYLLLKLLRDADVPYKVIATTASSSRTCRRDAASSCCVCASIPELGLVPEISGNRLMVSVRLMRHEADDRLHQSTEDAAFELTLCS
jgi:cell division protein ZapD